MDEIKKYELQISPIALQVFRILDSPMVINSTDSEIEDTVKKAILSAYFTIGWSYPDGEDFKIMVVSIVTHVKNTGLSLRLPELTIAFNRGVTKEYGDFMGLSIAAFIQFLNGYVKDDSRKQALIEFNKKNTMDSVQPSPNEIFDLSKGNALRALEDIKTGRDISLYASAVYNFLEQIKVLDLDDETIKEYQMDAKKRVVDDQQMLNMTEMDKFRRITNNQVIDAILKGSPNRDAKAKVILKAKYLAVKDFMEVAIMEDTKLDEIIELCRSEYLSTPNILEIRG